MPADRPGFDRLVYAIVRLIPVGRLMTYGQIASLIPAPASIDRMAYRRIGARWVGYALADCPPDVPWHRVVNRRGEPSRRDSGGHLLQRELLLQEGVAINSGGRFDLGGARWRPTQVELGQLQTEHSPGSGAPK